MDMLADTAVRNALIVGGGLAGLSAALSLAHHGVRVQVIDQTRLPFEFHVVTLASVSDATSDANRGARVDNVSQDDPSTDRAVHVSLDCGSVEIDESAAVSYSSDCCSVESESGTSCACHTY
jgi:2-polyprenyl-6-methoxyphenol hydroxylase-like FAD-dependent oxidoreductase